MTVSDLDELGPDERAILAAVPPDGSTIGNLALRANLKWLRQSQRYFTARNKLVEAGLLLRGRGRGGSARLAVTDERDDRGSPVVAVSPILNVEKALYEPMRAVIGGEWASERGIRPLAVETTAFQVRGVRAGCGHVRTSSASRSVTSRMCRGGFSRSSPSR
jgi:hypothetical protein